MDDTKKVSGTGWYDSQMWSDGKLIQQYSLNSVSILCCNHQRADTDLQVTCEQCGSFGFGHHSDLLEGQEIMDMDVVLYRRKSVRIVTTIKTLHKYDTK